MADISFECICGYKSKNIRQLDKHKIKCKYKGANLENNLNVQDSSICKYCKKIFARKYCCKRHMLICKSKPIDSDEKKSKFIEENFFEIEKEIFLLRNFINEYYSNNDEGRKLMLNNDKYKKQIELLMNYNPNNQSQNIKLLDSINSNTDNQITKQNNNQINYQGNNNTNNNITNNNTTNNNTTINNNTNISVVYPFGYENIYFLTDIEMINILTSGNCLIDAMNKIYCYSENKNFMKRNIKVENVTVIDKSCYIKVLKDDIFKWQIIKQTFESLKLMFNHCKNKLKIEHQIMLWQNLRVLDESIKENITYKKEEKMSIEIQQILDNITSMINEKNECTVSKAKFLEIKNSMINPEFKRVFDEKLNYIVAKMQEFRDDYNNRTIDLEFIMKNIWTRDIANDPKLSITHPDNHIKANDVVDTPRFKFFEEMTELKNKYLGSEDNNTTGNIDSVCNIREKNAEKEYNAYTKKYNLDVKERKILERKVINSRKYGVCNNMVAKKNEIVKTLTN